MVLYKPKENTRRGLCAAPNARRTFDDHPPIRCVRRLTDTPGAFILCSEPPACSRTERAVPAFIDLPGPCCCSQLGMLVQQTRLRAPTWRSASMLSLHRHDVGPTLYTTPWHVHRLENQQAALRQGRGVSRGEKLGAGPAEAAPAGAVPYATRAKGQGCSQGGRTGHAGQRLFALSRM